MKITYLHGFSIRLTFLDQFTLHLYYFLSRFIWGRVFLMQLYDIIRQFQVAVLIKRFNFVITSSSHKLSATLFSLMKNKKRTSENENIPCDYFNMLAILRFLYLASLFIRGSLIFANAARSMFILPLPRPRIKQLNLTGSGGLNCTAVQQPIWPYGSPIRTNNKYKVHQWCYFLLLL